MTGLVSALSGMVADTRGGGGLFGGNKGGDQIIWNSPRPDGSGEMVTKIGGGGGFNLMDMLSNGLTLASASMSLFAGETAAENSILQSQQEARALELQAQDDLLNARQEEIRGRQESNMILDNLIQTVAEQRLSAAANGVDVSFGTPGSVAENSRKLAYMQQSSARDDAVIKSLARRRQAEARREQAINTIVAGKRDAKAQRLSGIGNAVGIVGEAVMRKVNRG